jgi:aminopeptidase YwaD
LRAAFLGAASAWYLAGLDAAGTPALWEVVRRGSLARTAEALARRDRLRAMGEAAEGDSLLRFHFAYEAGVIESIGRFAEMPAAVRAEAEAFLAALRGLQDAGAGLVPAREGPESIVYRRAPEPKGPMGGFGYDYFEDHSAQKGIPRPALLQRTGLWGGGEYAYEALNLVDGRRTVRQIRDDLTAIYGPVPLAEVAEYLAALEKIGILSR